MREANVIHRATSGYSRVLCDTSSWSDRVPRSISGYKSASIGYFRSRCNVSGCKVECDERARSVKIEQRGSVHRAED
jgi:hypothetical protein